MRAMKPRITINTNKEGELELWVNELGRDLLVRELQHLSERSDHFHFGPEELDGEVGWSSLMQQCGLTASQNAMFAIHP